MVSYDKAWIEEVLTCLNWPAAPFGSQEHLVRAFGVNGSTFTLQGTDPILTSRGQNLRRVPIDLPARQADGARRARRGRRR
jgi:putative aldouronate transport system substrate-binding protein